jgi:hypothetical protein
MLVNVKGEYRQGERRDSLCSSSLSFVSVFPFFVGVRGQNGAVSFFALA